MNDPDEDNIDINSLVLEQTNIPAAETKGNVPPLSNASNFSVGSVVSVECTWEGHGL